MNKRKFLQALLTTGGVIFSSRLHFDQSTVAPPVPSDQPKLISQAEVKLMIHPEDDNSLLDEKDLKPGFKHTERLIDISELDDEDVDSYLEKIRNFNSDYLTDIFLSEENAQTLEPTLARLIGVQNFIGHGNFNLLGFDEMLYFARKYSEIGAFEQFELDFLEEIFSTDAKTYGFFGSKVNFNLNARISHSDVEKISGSGHYLLKGASLSHYQQIRKDVGDKIFLTSGVRNIVKQMYLFLAKTRQSRGNLSRASRSLAPPGHSYHSSGDFDVGKIGLGEKNFTADFSTTEEFKRMISLDYVGLRYPDSNSLGVRYEPWHIKIS